MRRLQVGLGGKLAYAADRNVTKTIASAQHVNIEVGGMDIADVAAVAGRPGVRDFIGMVPPHGGVPERGIGVQRPAQLARQARPRGLRAAQRLGHAGGEGPTAGPRDARDQIGMPQAAGSVRPLKCLHRAVVAPAGPTCSCRDRHGGNVPDADTERDLLQQVEGVDVIDRHGAVVAAAHDQRAAAGVDGQGVRVCPRGQQERNG